MPSNFKKYQTKFKILLKLFYDRIDKQKLHKRPNCRYLNKIKASIGRKDIFKSKNAPLSFIDKILIPVSHGKLAVSLTQDFSRLTKRGLT